MAPWEMVGIQYTKKKSPWGLPSLDWKQLCSTTLSLMCKTGPTRQGLNFKGQYCNPGWSPLTAKLALDASGQLPLLPSDIEVGRCLRP